ncbi:hypothetical protein TUM4630_09250 [Shewanella algidipiscicola]|uniref:Uncharacterized protein n=1 Tax=Shewanella algidipiscicola TaxID=614070 RepID=A0ABQ4P9G7_9GAMM|nr:hypothetical protein TUM4630_09250 [Shewanella algidipiscicola]
MAVAKLTLSLVVGSKLRFTHSVAEVFAHEVVPSHPCDHDIGAAMHCTCGRQLANAKVNA